jgi:DNA-binding transcriptional LysR family regulator
MTTMFDTNLLKTFLAVVETRHFTAAGRQLGLSQSTISQHIRRLELACGRQLLARDTHAVALTADGNVMAGFARDIVEASQRAVDHFADSTPRGRVRFGVSEDLALTRLPQILRNFMGAHPQLSLELSVGLTSMLYQKLDTGRLDLVFAKRRQGDDRGELVKTEQLTWMAHREFTLDASVQVPLVLYPSSSITSALAVEAMNRAGRSWFIACSSETLGGVRAGVLAGLGVTAQSRLLLQQHSDLVEAPAEAELPEVGEVEFVVLGRSARLQGAAAALADLVLEQGPQLWSMP